jgi:hypothetical protein
VASRQVISAPTEATEVLQGATQVLQGATQCATPQVLVPATTTAGEGNDAWARFLGRPTTPRRYRP